MLFCFYFLFSIYTFLYFHREFEIQNFNAKNNVLKLKHNNTKYVGISNKLYRLLIFILKIIIITI